MSQLDSEKQGKALSAPLVLLPSLILLLYSSCSLSFSYFPSSRLFSPLNNRRMIQHFNEVSSWVRSQLVRECRLQRRIDLLEWLVLVVWVGLGLLGGLFEAGLMLEQQVYSTYGGVANTQQL